MDIGHYQTLRLLGKGGMSEVYEVSDGRFGTRHALKLYAYAADRPDVRERFLVEGRLLATLRHPRVVRVTDVGTDAASGRPYFVMDLVVDAGGAVRPLSEVAPGTVDEETVGRWYDDMREGLAYVHANGVVHRDLKLENVLVGPDGHVVIADFGVSKVAEAGASARPPVDPVRTVVQMRDGRPLLMGSLGYMAPELELGVEASPQSDYYALGVIAYRLLTGSWCDARTDVVGALEGYDPAWTRILPNLLHANPKARTCLSFADEREADRRRTQAETEECLRLTGASARRARREAGVGCVLSILLAAAAVILGIRAKTNSRPPGFEALFAVPANAGLADSPSIAEFRMAQIDAWMLMGGELSRLHEQGTEEARRGLVERLENIRLKLRADPEETLDDEEFSEDYTQQSDGAALLTLVEQALERLK